MQRELERALEHYRAAPQDAVRWLKFGQGEAPSIEGAPELAAYTLLASLVLNLDEALTHE
jgi:hypothetical protein